MSTARVIAAAAAAGLVAMAEWLAPQLANRLVPSLLDIAVGAAFAAAAVIAAGRDRAAPAVALAGAALLWAFSGAAAALPPGAGDLALRTSLLPHALLVVAAALLPSGRVRDPRAVALLVAASAIGVAAGLGVLRPALLLLGLAAIGSAARRWRPLASAVQIGLGIGLVGTDIGTLTGAIAPAPASVVVDLLLISGAAATATALTARDRLWTVTAVPHVRGVEDPLGAQLAALLDVRSLQVGFPRVARTQGEYVDIAGRTIEMRDDAMRFAGPDGETIARVHPPTRIDPFLASDLRGILTRAGELARLRAEQRDRADDVERSRRLLLRAADDERSDLEARLTTTVGAQLDQIIGELVLLPDQDVLVARARFVRAEIVGFAHSTQAPVGPTELDARIRDLCRSSGIAFESTIDSAFAPPHALMRVSWFLCVEGVVNAAKHAPGARVMIDASVESGIASLTVTDDGPGGAVVGGSGLGGLADRAADADAEFGVQSGASGTVLSLRFEMPRAEMPGFPSSETRGIHDVSPSEVSVP